MKVTPWGFSVAQAQLFTTAITQAEILYGIALLPKSARREKLTRVTREIFEEEFADKVLAFDARAAEGFAKIAAQRRSASKPISQLAAMIAATASVHQARLITRNGRDFAECGIDLYDPWNG